MQSDSNGLEKKTKFKKEINTKANILTSPKEINIFQIKEGF